MYYYCHFLMSLKRDRQERCTAAEDVAQYQIVAETLHNTRFQPSLHNIWLFRSRVTAAADSGRGCGQWWLWRTMQAHHSSHYRMLQLPLVCRKSTGSRKNGSISRDLYPETHRNLALLILLRLSVRPLFLAVPVNYFFIFLNSSQMKPYSIDNFHIWSEH